MLHEAARGYTSRGRDRTSIAHGPSHRSAGPVIVLTSASDEIVLPCRVLAGDTDDRE